MTDRRAVRAAALAAFAALLSAPGTALAKGDNVIVSGSVYVDYWGIDDPLHQVRAPRSVSPEASLKVQVDIHDDLAFSAKACVSCHGIDVEHAVLDYTPKLAFNVMAGRLAVPFGEYANRVDPSGHKTASAPLIWDMGRAAYLERGSMNFGVVPQPYIDTGVMIYGVKWLGKIQAWYGIYGVAGMRGSNDLDFTSMRSIYYYDNNNEPAGGARLALTLSSNGGFFGDLSLGGSFTAGTYDQKSKLKYWAAAADASMILGPFTLRGEWAARRSDLDPNATYRYEVIDPFINKEGWYAELEHPLGKYLHFVYRYDELLRSGVPLPGSNAALTPESRIVRYSAGFVLSPAGAVYLKGGWEYWQPSDFAEFHSYHVGFGGAF